MALPNPITASQTDANSPLNMALLDAVRLNLDDLDTRSGSGGGLNTVFYKEGDLLPVAERPVYDTPIPLPAGTYSELDVAVGVPGTETDGSLELDVLRRTAKNVKVSSIATLTSFATTASSDKSYDVAASDVTRRYSALAVSSHEFAVAEINASSVSPFREVEGRGRLLLVNLDSAIDKDLWETVGSFRSSGFTDSSNNNGFVKIIAANVGGANNLLVEDEMEQVGSESSAKIRLNAVKLNFASTPGAGFTAGRWVDYGKVAAVAEVIGDAIVLRDEGYATTDTITSVESNTITYGITGADALFFGVGEKVDTGDYIDDPEITEVNTNGIVAEVPGESVDVSKAATVLSKRIRFSVGAAADIADVSVGDRYPSLAIDTDAVNFGPGAVAAKSGTSIYIYFPGYTTGTFTLGDFKEGVAVNPSTWPVIPNTGRRGLLGVNTTSTRANAEANRLLTEKGPVQPSLTSYQCSLIRGPSETFFLSSVALPSLTMSVNGTAYTVTAGSNTDTSYQLSGVNAYYYRIAVGIEDGNVLKIDWTGNPDSDLTLVGPANIDNVQTFDSEKAKIETAVSAGAAVGDFVSLRSLRDGGTAEGLEVTAVDIDNGTNVVVQAPALETGTKNIGEVEAVYEKMSATVDETVSFFDTDGRVRQYDTVADDVPRGTTLSLILRKIADGAAGLGVRLG